MAEDTIKLPWISWEVPKPKGWDLAAAAVMAATLGAVAGNLWVAVSAPPGEPIGGTATFGFVVAHLLLATGALLVLGKTAKEGTLWGNLAAVVGMLVGVSGVLLAAALWSAA